MKKILVSLAALLLSLSALAIPAKPGVFTYTQPDGSVVRLERHGDEFYSWTTLAGTTQAVELDADGFWRPVTLDSAVRNTARERRLQANRQRSVQLRTHNDDPMTHGTRHIPVLLVEFQDVAFKLQDPADKFNALLNENGYSANGGTGSVQDFYLDNSKGAFQPIFDVYGPVKLPEKMSYYGKRSGRDNDARPEIALYHAALLLDSTVDFSQYDYNNDGYVDMTLFYYAGYNEAEGGSTNTIWPHQWSLQYSSNQEARNARFDGLGLDAYFCTSELKGSQGTNMCGIGTTCHEFGHSLGLPDFYDTDYEENGSCSALSSFSTMCSGSYNNDGRTPPYFNAEERVYLGWMIDSDIQDLPAGEISFGSVKDDIAYRSYTDVEGEYFLYECRDGSGWDAPLPKGLLVYHVDKSQVRKVGNITPYEHWTHWSWYNQINAYGDHPCFYVVPAADQSNLQYNKSLDYWVFPGTKKVKSYVPVDWNGSTTDTSLSNIAYADGKVSFTAVINSSKIISGQVTDMSGHPLEGVHVVLTPKEQSSGAPSLRKISLRTVSVEAGTDANGYFSMDLDGFEATQGHLTFSLEGFQTDGMDVELNKKKITVQFQLKRDDEGELILYRYWDPGADRYVFGDGENNSLMAAIRIPAEEVPQNGGTLLSVAFTPLWTAKSHYVIVDAGTERLYTIPLHFNEEEYGMLDVDLSDYNLTVPGGKDLYIGYGLEEAQPYYGYDGYLFMCVYGQSNYYLGSLNLQHSDWNSISDVALMLDAYILENKDGGSGGDPEEPSFAKMGITAIQDPGLGTYQAGDVFQLELEVPDNEQVQVSWKFDGLTVTDPVTLQAGSHVVTATVQHANGDVETLELLIEVK